MASLCYHPPSLRRKKNRSSALLPTTDTTRPVSLKATLQENNQVTVQDPESVKHLTNTGSYGTLIQQDISIESQDPSVPPPNKRICHDETVFLDHASSVPTHLYLSHLESFYLMHTSDMIISSPSDCLTNISLLSLWQLSIKADESFPIKYIAYLQLREQGWVVKCGLKFGVDFLLYKTSPSLYHSSYAVIIRTINNTTSINSVGVSSDTINSVGVSSDWLSWKQVVSLVRVIEGVAKEMVVCFVDVNKWEESGVWSEENIKNILSHSKVSFVIVKRHQPEKERE